MPPISCHLYDHLELACVKRYQLELRLRDASHCRGIAVDLFIQSREEQLRLKPTAASERVIALTDIVEVRVLDKAPRFSYLNFESGEIN